MPDPTHAQLLTAINNIGDGLTALSADVRHIKERVDELSEDTLIAKQRIRRHSGRLSELESEVKVLEGEDRDSSVHLAVIKRDVDSIRAKGVLVSIAKVVLPKGFGEISLTGFSGATVIVILGLIAAGLVAWLMTR